MERSETSQGDETSLVGLSPPEVVEFHHGLEAEWIAEQDVIKASWDQETPYPDTELNQRYHRHIQALHELPVHNSEHAASVYSLLANSDDKSDRELIAYMIAELARANTDEALPLWEKLLNDENGDVIRAAWDALLEAAQDEERPLLLTLRKIRPLLEVIDNRIL